MAALQTRKNVAALAYSTNHSLGRKKPEIPAPMGSIDHFAKSRAEYSLMAYQRSLDAKAASTRKP